MRTKPVLRTAAIVVAALIAVGTPVAQWLTGTLGVGQGQLANEGNQTLEAAGYAFSIWGLIYGGLLAYAAYQALPTSPESPGLKMLGWPSVVAMLGCAAWLVAASLDIKWMTVAIIVISAIVLVVPLLKRYPAQSTPEFWLVACPVSMLAGWLTVASAINLLTVLTSEGWIDAGAAPVWAGGGVAVVLLVGVAVASASRNWVYPLPIAWGFVAVAVAEQVDRPMVAVLALGSAALLAGVAAWVVIPRRRLLPRPRQQ